MIPSLPNYRGFSVTLPLATLIVGCNLLSKQEAPTKQDTPPAPVFVTSATPAVSAALPAAPSGVPQATSTEVPQAPRDAYSMEGLGELPANCTDPGVVLLAVPKKIFESDSFDWRHARQVVLANPQFEVARNLTPGSKSHAIAFTENEHQPTKGVALVAHCKTAATCLELAAAYRTVVPTAKPTPICGANPNVGARIQGGRSVLPPNGSIGEILPGDKDIQSQCVRLAACKAARDHALSDDETQGCMRKPSDFKIRCALKKTCSEVLTCSGQ